MNAKTILLEAFDARWEKFRAELKLCRAEFSEEAVHDLRVASRRLLAFLDLLRSVVLHKRIQKIRRVLKDQLDDLDDLRDAQVLLADISESLHELPELEFFKLELQAEERKLLKHARKAIQSRDFGRLKTRIGKTREMIEGLPVEPLTGQLLSAGDEIHARMMAAHTAMSAENIPGIHKLRIAFKRFRYVVEIIHPLLPNYPEGHLKRMHDYQAGMGDIQDMDTALQKLADLKDPASQPGFESVMDHFKTRLQGAVSDFIESSGEAFVFWRSAPDQPFPWEKNRS
ncbi:MAG: CHAD domain-containing protein [Anaerolineales bacterium]|nr:CHAD domain-containing protein [Anaerolineales bacterium]